MGKVRRYEVTGSAVDKDGPTTFHRQIHAESIQTVLKTVAPDVGDPDVLHLAVAKNEPEEPET